VTESHTATAAIVASPHRKPEGTHERIINTSSITTAGIAVKVLGIPAEFETTVCRLKKHTLR
jgi:hypothetical protein